MRPRELASPFHHMVTWQGGVIYEEEGSPGPHHTGAQTWDFLASRTADRTFLTYKVDGTSIGLSSLS